MIIQGDCIEKMKELPENSVDTIITDPPYGLSFMGKKWDYDVPSKKVWKECLRVLKPGGTALIFAGSRTQHRMAVNVEDAGFLLKDCIMWLYGSGFPKATDISKQLDKRGGNNHLASEFAIKLKEARTSRGIGATQADKMFCGGTTNYSWFEGRPKGQRMPTDKEAILIMNEWEELKPLLEKVLKVERDIVGKYDADMGGLGGERLGEKDGDITVSKTPEAKLWNGWKSHGLKPAYEPIIVAQKPNDGTYANNAMKWGVAGINIDGARIGSELPEGRKRHGGGIKGNGTSYEMPDSKGELPSGRFPANILLDEEAAKQLGEPSRFFYCPKASKSERNAGCEELEEKKVSDGRQKATDILIRISQVNTFRGQG